jgi:hypothetical protein
MANPLRILTQLTASQAVKFLDSGSFSGDLTVEGDLNVQGSLTYLDTENLKIRDKLIELNVPEDGMMPVSNSGAGFFISGSDPSKDITITLDGDGGNLVANTKLSASGLETSGELTVYGQAFISSSLFISGASFNEGEPGEGADQLIGWVSGSYSVDNAFRALAGFTAGAIGRYSELRHVTTMSLDAGGIKTYELPTDSPVFNAQQLNNVMVDVLVLDDFGGWVNDLISVKLAASMGGGLQVEISAPAHGTGSIRLIAVNEALGLFEEDPAP